MRSLILKRLVVLTTPVLLALGFASCTSRPPITPRLEVASIRQRTLQRFHRSYLLKPANSASDASLARQFAPLLVCEAPAATNPPLLPAQVYFHSSSVQIAGRQHAQFTFWWRVRPNCSSTDPAATIQGIRLTLDSEGRPVIWEVLAEANGLRVFYAAESLEAAAVRDYGPVRSLGDFSLERAADGAGVLARLLSDGPVPMGPIIYLRADAKEVTTVICRCMPSQADEVSGQAEYELVAAPAAPDFGEFPTLLRLPRNF